MLGEAGEGVRWTACGLEGRVLKGVRGLGRGSVVCGAWGCGR